jgi:hypothetical protein
MTEQEKKAFLCELTSNVLQEVLAKVPNMPAEWDGHELRAYLAEKFAISAMTVGSKRPEWRKRTKEFRNEMLVRNI